MFIFFFVHVLASPLTRVSTSTKTKLHYDWFNEQFAVSLSNSFPLTLAWLNLKQKHIKLAGSTRKLATPTNSHSNATVAMEYSFHYSFVCMFKYKTVHVHCFTNHTTIILKNKTIVVQHQHHQTMQWECNDVQHKQTLNTQCAQQDKNNTRGAHGMLNKRNTRCTANNTTTLLLNTKQYHTTPAVCTTQTKVLQTKFNNSTKILPFFPISNFVWYVHNVPKTMWSTLMI